MKNVSVKKLFLVSLLMASAGIVHADSLRLVTADGADLSAVCIAAVTSREAMYETAAALGIEPLDVETLRCNDMTVSRFVATTRNSVARIELPTSYMFSKSDDSPVTELCMAALSSDQEYLKVKEEYFGADPRVETEVMCNDMPLKSFARKYRAPARTVSLN
ncbi:MAG: hypothetical protein RLZZ227_2909 [Pseudomonadota bacterium]|jgi:hypothetical protein